MILGNHSRKLLKDKHHLLDNFAQGFSCQHKHSTTQGVIRKATKGVWVQINILFSYCKLRSVSSWCFESCRLICVCAQSLTGVWLFATPWTVAHQAPLSMGFQRQEYRSGLPFLSPGDLLNPGIKPGLLHCRQSLLSSESPGKPIYIHSGWLNQSWGPWGCYLSTLCPCLCCLDLLIFAYKIGVWTRGLDPRMWGGMV